MQHSKPIRPIVLPSVACPTLQYFSTLPHKRYDFLRGKKVVEHKICVLIFLQALPETFFILRTIQRNIHVKCPLFLSDLNET